MATAADWDAFAVGAAVDNEGGDGGSTYCEPPAHVVVRGTVQSMSPTTLRLRVPDADVHAAIAAAERKVAEAFGGQCRIYSVLAADGVVKLRVHGVQAAVGAQVECSVVLRGGWRQGTTWCGLHAECMEAKELAPPPPKQPPRFPRTSLRPPVEEPSDDDEGMFQTEVFVRNATTKKPDDKADDKADDDKA